MPRQSFRPQLEQFDERLPPSSLNGGFDGAKKPDVVAQGDPHSSAFVSNSALVPAHSHAYGHSFEELNFLYTKWAIETGLGGGSDIPGGVGKVQFLPTSVTGSGAFTFNVTLAPGTPFVAPTFFVFGERYDDPNVPDDKPGDLAALGIFETATINLVLDGKVVVNGVASDLKQLMYGPTYFDQPIVYTTPQSRGPGLNATAALFVQGIGTVFHPLSAGQHTLVSTVHSQFFGDFQYTYHITVSRK